MTEPQLPDVRASDAERERIVAELREHCAVGRLTLEEFSGRADEAYAAKTLGELERVTRDLPDLSVPLPDRPRRKARRFVLSVMGGLDRKGRWRVPKRLTVVSIMGGCDLDFRQAQIESDVVRVTIVNIMGGVDVYVPEGIEVDVGGFTFMGGSDEHGDDPPPRPGTPLIRARVFTLMGGTDVWRVPQGMKGKRLREVKRSIRAGTDSREGEH